MSEHDWQNDTEFQDHTIEKVEPSTGEGGGYYLTFDGSTGIYCPPVELGPVVGEIVRLFGRGFGYPVRGVLIGDGATWRTARYQTEAQYRAQCAADLIESKRLKIEAFETKGRSELDAKYDALPDIFKRRIDKFRANNPDFRWEYEGYEMFCCTQAVAFAGALKTIQALDAWRALDWKEQREQVPAMDDGHSGNTFGAACALAALYLSRPDDVVRLHGALAPLVGSEEYGCVPKKAAV